MRLLILYSLLVLSYSLKGQIVNIVKTKEAIIIDGDLEEEVWKKAEVITDFNQYFPLDTTKAVYDTEIYLTYDDEFLYVAAKCFSENTDYITQSLKRDYRAFGSDNITFLFDTYSDLTNSFVFGMNAYGVQREAMVSNGGTNRQDFSSSWDNKWYGESKISDNYWSCELAIPFKSIRFKEGESNWGFNAYRVNTQNNEISSWIEIPQNQLLMNLAYSGKIKWDEPLQKSGKNIAVIPYVTGNVMQENATLPISTDFNGNFGGDAKIGLTSGLNLDLTVNPDFSQVEVDNEIANLGRFELFLPEKRQFFLENADLFSSFGNQNVNPFFSRRIGLIENKEDDLIQNPIIAGARVSGKLDNNWRVGLLSMQTAKNDTLGLPNYNYSVAAIQRKVFDRSNIAFIFTNKQAINYTQDSTTDYSLYDRLVGVDYNLSSADGKWQGKIYYHQNFSSNSDYQLQDKLAHGTDIRFINRNIKFSWRHNWIKAGFNPEIGFVPRNDYFMISPEAEYYFYPKNKNITRYSLGTQATIFWRPTYNSTDRQLELFWNPVFKDNSNLKLILQHNYTFLTEEDEFNPLSDSVFLPTNMGYNYINLRGRYFSDTRKIISYTIRPNIGQFYNGYRYSIGGNLNCRLSYFGSLGIDAAYNYINFPDEYGDGEIWVLGPKLDLTFTKNLFFSTLVQYNSQEDDFIINARLQWRFKPVSDFFIVYTDNYSGPDLLPQNRAIVAKLTYWFNM